MEFKDLFKKLEPPRSGLEGLRIKLEKREKKKKIRTVFLKPSFWPYAGITAALIFIFIFLMVQAFLGGTLGLKDDSFRYLVAQSDDPSLVRYDLVKFPEEAVTVPKKGQKKLAVLKVPVQSEEVIFYWVSSLPSEEEQDNKSDQPSRSQPL